MAAEPWFSARSASLRRVFPVVLLVVLAATVAALLVLGIDILFAAFGGILFAVLLRAMAGLIARYTPVRERWSYTVVLVLLVALLTGAAFVAAPFVQEQVQQARDEIPRIAADVEGFLKEREWGRWILRQARDGGGEQAAQGAFSAAGTLLGRLTDWFYYTLTAFFVGLFAAARPALYMEGVASLFPLGKRERVLRVLDELGFTLRWWLVGQLLSMLIIGASTWLVLYLLGVPLALPLALLVGLLGFVPYLGPIIGLVPVSIVAGMQGADLLFYVAGTYLAVQMIEGYVITPLIQHRMVYLPPMFTVIAQILLGSIFGALGFIFATPLAAVVLVLSRFYREDLLGERGVVAQGRQD
jgi:predicted PurR-regulated permease PerM